MHMLQTHSPAIFSVIGFFLVSFGPFSTVHYNTIRMRFHFDPLSRVFSNGCVFDEIAQRISVDGRPKRVECTRFQTKTN